MRFSLRLFWMLCCYLLLRHSDLQAQQVNIKHYGVNAGLPSSECYWIMQDSKGYIWIATDAGVVKYDGYKFQTYTSSKGLPDNTVFKIHEDRKGNIWFASYSGKMSYYQYQTDSIYSIPGNKQLSNIVKIAPVDFAFDNHDTLWISYYIAGYVKLAPPYYNDLKADQKHSPRFFIQEIDPGKYIYGCDQEENKPPLKAPFFYCKKNQKPEQRLIISSAMNRLSLSQNQEGELFYSTGWRVLKFTENSTSVVVDSLSKTVNTIIGTYIDQANSLWVCTYDQGLLQYDQSNFAKPPRRFLASEAVSCVIQDRDMGYWVSTLYNGIFYIPSFQFQYLPTGKTYSLNRYDSTFFFIDDANKLRQLKLRDSISQKINDLHCWFCYATGGKVIVSANNSYIYTIATKETIPFYEIDDAEKTKKIIQTKYIADLNTEYFVAISNNTHTLFKINKQTGEAQKLIEHVPLVFSVVVLDNKIYLGTMNGLFLYENGRMENVALFPDNPNSRIEAMCVYQGALIVATRGDGVVWMEQNKPVWSMNESNGLLSNICKSINTDADGNIWIGTNKGISCLLHENNRYDQVKNFTMNDGLSSNEINSIIFNQNTVYVATTNGINYFDRLQVLAKKDLPSLFIEKINVNGIGIEELNGKELPYDRNYIQLYFKCILPKAEGDLVYRYKLVGFDNDWVSTKSTFVQYTSLPDGTYEFILAGPTNYSDAASPIHIRFTILPPFWKTWWFIGLCILVTIVLLLISYRISVHYVREKEAKKNNVQRLLVESELKALRAQMNPHFVFNAINSIQNFVIKNESVAAQKYLTMFSRLIRSVLENSKHETILLATEIETLSLYIQLEALRASFRFTHEIVVSEAVKKSTLYIPTMLIQPYIENAILHGLLPLNNRSGKLLILFEEKPNELICTIDDNGIGRVAAQKNKQNKNLNHQSMGMEITNDRMENLNRFASMQTSVVIIDKEDLGEPMGTQVIITIKYT